MTSRRVLDPVDRVSEVLFGLIMVLGAGFEYGRRMGRRPWTLGAAMVVLGTLLTGLTIALGG